MAKRKASRSRGPASRTGRPSTVKGRTSALAPGPLTFGISPSFFAFRARDGRGVAIQLVSVAGIGLGLLAALDRYGGSTPLAGSEQITQFVYLVSVFGLLALPLGVAAATDVLLTWLARRGALSSTVLARATLLVPPLVAFVAGCAVPLVLFALGGQPLYLAVAGIVLTVVVGWSAALYVRRWWQAGEGSNA